MPPPNSPAPARCLAALTLLLLPTLFSCREAQESEGTESVSASSGVQDPRLGPKDGHDLDATELDRVAVGGSAPDFTLRSLGGQSYTLSDFRGRKDVILVFYRGHW